MSLPVKHFDILWSPILVPLFRIFGNGSDESLSPGCWVHENN